MKNKLLVLLLALCLYKTYYSQNPITSNYVPFSQNGIFDTLYDYLGNKYALKDQIIYPPAGYLADNLRPVPTASCSAGYFNLYFAPGTVWTGANAVAMQNVLCNVYTDISNFINSPLSTLPGVGQKINIYCGNTTGGQAGTASAFELFPLNPSNPNPGVIDNVIYKTIVSGNNPYANVLGIFNFPSNFYHGIVNASPSLSFHTNLGTNNISITDIDLYTIMLHEACHSLGFYTLIGSTGVSVYGSANNYYSKYDTYLTNNTGVPLLTTTTPSCANTGLTFTGPTSQINPSGCLGGGTDITNCLIAARYTSTNINVAVYTPTCYQAGSSLSHFEDMCSVPTGFTSTCTVFPAGSNNNLYYVMSNAIYAGNCYVKRHYVEEERYALCDLGYSVKNVYTSFAVGGNFTYTGTACSVNNIWGIDDGISPTGGYTLQLTSSCITIPKSTLLANDSPTATSVSCVSLVYNNSNISFTETPTQITICKTGSNTVCGLIMLQYFPKDAAGNLGNATYVSIFSPCISCSTTSACNLVQNNGFETATITACSTGGFLFPGYVSCWDNYTGSCDYFNRFCVANPNQQIGNPACIAQFGLSDTHNGAPNNKCLGGALLITTTSPSLGLSESYENSLSSPLIPNNTYVVSFWAMYNTITVAAFPSVTKPMVYSLASSVNFTSTVPGAPTFPIGLNVFASFTLSPVPNLWTFYTTTVTFSSPGNVPHNFIICGPDIVKTSNLNGNIIMHSWANVDDISILPIGLSGGFNMPNPLCAGVSFTNIAQYADPIPGSFSGTGVTFSGGQYNFNSPPTLPTGVYPVAFTYTNAGCVNTTWSNAYIPTVTVQTNSTTCTSNNYTLNTNYFPPGTSFTWLPSGQTTSSIVVSPLVNTIYTLVVANGTCSATYTLPILLTPTIAINPVPLLCIGTASSSPFLQTFIATGTPTNGSFSGLNIFNGNCSGVLCSFISPTPPVGIYNYTYTVFSPSLGIFCPVSTTFNVQFTPNFTLTSSGQTYCTNIPGAVAVIGAIASASAGVNFIWQPSSLSGASQTLTPATTTIYTVNATNGGCLQTNTVLVNVSNACCTATNYITSSIVGAPGTTLNLFGNYAVNQNITLQGLVTFGGVFAMAPNVKVTVAPNATLISTGFSDGLGLHMYSCGDMWDGIDVQNSGKLNFSTNSDLIEDAIAAITSNGATNTNTTSLDVVAEGVVFNKNRTSIAIKNYTQTTTNSPFNITKCVFTSRDFSLTPFAIIWPNAGTVIPGLRAITSATNTLFSPYNLQNYAADNLKAPYATIPSSVGVLVENSGTTANPTSTNPIFTSILVGDKGQIDNNYFNLFDNLLFGIYGSGSNVESQNNTFQNTRRVVVCSPRCRIIGGYGIYCADDALTTTSNNYLLATHPSGFSNNGRINKFYDCYIGVGLYRMFTTDVQYADFKGSQTTVNPPSGPLVVTGVVGVDISGNRLKNYKISNNKMQNLIRGVSAQLYYNPLNLPGQPTYGQYLGGVAIANNTIAPQLPGTVVAGTARIFLGVYASNVFFSGVSSFKEPSTDFRINDNRMANVWRGVQLLGFNITNYSAVAANNTITLIQDATVQQQYGVYCANGYANIINNNRIVGFNTTNTLVTGVYCSMNSAPTNTALALTSVQCNSVTNLFAGFEFASYNGSSFWRNNRMQLNKRGLFLSSNGIIGQQGNSGSASDNTWNGAWVGNNGTWTDGASFATNSKLFVRNTSPYFPPTNSGSIQANSYFVSVNLPLAGGPFVNCSPTGGGGGGGGSSPNRIAFLDSVVTDNITFTVNVAETQEIYKNAAYNDVVNEPTLTIVSPTLNTFYSTNLTTARGLYKNIEASFAQGNLSGVATLLAAFTPSTNIENNYSTYYNLLKNYTANGYLTVLQQLQLAILAHQCPFTDGSVVYDARALYNLVKETVVVYNDNNCSRLGFSFRTNNNDSVINNNPQEDELLAQLITNEQITKAKFKPLIEYKLYPNPAINEVTIISNFEREKLDVKITDVNGKLLVSKTLNMLDYRADLKFDLINGIYFVNLTNEQGVKTVKKLVITK